MKKQKFLIISATLLSTCLMASCGGNELEDLKASNLKVIEEAQKMTREDLFKKAAEEIGGGELKFVGTSSRFKNAIDPFKKELAKYNPECEKLSITKDSKVDGQIYLTLCGEIEAGLKTGYDAALVQDGYQLQKLGINTGYFLNYVPYEWSQDQETDKNVNANPFSLQYNMKTWMVNNGGKGKDVVIDNVWDITSSKYKNHLHTMSPNNENVNRDWLIMLTKDEWCDNLKAAFEDSTNDNKDLDIDQFKDKGEKQKYAYAFIDRFLDNAVFYEDDGKARDALCKDEGSIGWIVYSKIASIQETEAISKKNITIAALGKENADGSKVTNSFMNGFGGFMYKHYLQVMPYTQHPWTSCAFINFLSTTKEGYAAWSKDIGDYPSMPSINVDRTKYGHGVLNEDYTFTQDNNAENVFPCLNDPQSSWWTGTAKTVIEEPAYIINQYTTVDSFIRARTSK